jgi:hypothetical protein
MSSDRTVDDFRLPKMTFTNRESKKQDLKNIPSHQPTTLSLSPHSNQINSNGIIIIVSVLL